MPLEGLSIPKEDEEKVMALVENYANQAPGCEFDDFIAGKGRGLVMLLQYDI